MTRTRFALKCQSFRSRKCRKKKKRRTACCHRRAELACGVRNGVGWDVGAYWARKSEVMARNTAESARLRSRARLQIAPLANAHTRERGNAPTSRSLMVLVCTPSSTRQYTFGLWERCPVRSRELGTSLGRHSLNPGPCFYPLG